MNFGCSLRWKHEGSTFIEVKGRLKGILKQYEKSIMVEVDVNIYLD